MSLQFLQFQGLRQNYKWILLHLKHSALGLLACCPLPEYLDSARYFSSPALSLSLSHCVHDARVQDTPIFSFLNCSKYIYNFSAHLQVSIPLGMHEGLPVSVSLLATHGSDGFLLSLVETLYGTLKEQVESLNFHPCL